jgi:hypothetical protein
MDKRADYRRLHESFNAQLPKECANCGSTCNLMIHHIVPLCYGGNNVLSNLSRLCSECHSNAHGGKNFVKANANMRLDYAKQGKWPSGTPPYGYTITDGRLSIDERTSEIVRWIFDLRYRSELSTTVIADILNEMSIPPAKYGKAWSHISVVKILENSVYFGQLTYAGVNYGNVVPQTLDSSYEAIISEFKAKYKGKRIPQSKGRVIKEKRPA